MLLALFRTRIKAVLVTVVLAFAAPRVARLLRSVGQRQQRKGGGALTTTVPLTAADALEKVASWARPEKKQRRFGRR